MKEKKKVLLVQYGHESSTVNPFTADLSRFGGKEQLITGNPQGDLGSFIADFRSVFDGRPDIELVETVDAWANPWGKVERNVHELVKSIIRRKAEEAGKIDGVLLMLHGAMVLEDDEDGEGELLEFIRELAGENTPVYAVLDLHANITEKMIRNASVLINCDTYPHIDLRERAQEAAQLMLDTLDGKCQPVMAACKLPLLSEFIPTTTGVGAEILNAVLELEKRPGILSVSVAYGFFCADIYESGVCVIAVADRDKELAAASAAQIGRVIWNVRERMHGANQSIEQVLNEISASPEKFPAVIADCCDNPGGGATGESTHILRSLLEHGIDDVLVAFIHDPEAVRAAEAAGVGSEIEFSIGGHLAPEYDGEPFCCRAKVKAIADSLLKHGKVAALQTGRTCIIVQNGTGQTWDTSGIDACGENIADYRVTVVKSAVHFRHAFTPLVKTIYSVCGSGLAPQQISLIDFRNCRRPVYPLDKDTCF